MIPTEQVHAAISRVLMLAAGPLDTEEELAAVRSAMAAFDGDERALEELVLHAAVEVNAKIPDGGALAFGDAADLAAFAIVTNAASPSAVVVLVRTLPRQHLGDVATSLLAFWRQACSQVAMDALRDVRIPDHLPKES